MLKQSLFRVFNLSAAKKNSPFEIDIHKQGKGRFDIIHKDTVIYLSLQKISAIAECILHLRNMNLNNRDFEVGEDTVKTLAEIRIIKKLNTADLNDIKDLERYNIKPSEVVTHDREITRRVSEKIYDSQVDGFLWWSSIESKWKNATLFKSRAEKKLKVQSITRLSVDVEDVQEAARFLNIKIVTESV